MADAVEHYPNGSAALLRQADISARAGDADGTLAALHALYQRGFERFDLLMHPDYAFLREDPRFKALVDEVARKRIARIASSQAPGQIGYHTIGLVHNSRGDTDAAIRAFERALEIGGAKDQQIRAELKKLRARQRREALRPPRGEGR
jgi:tetratricopeptide (TPR) repeat protein